MSTERPLSPHLQAYKMPFAGLLSITHRITGFMLSTLGMLLLVYWLSGVAGGPAELAERMKVLNNPFLVLIYFGMTFFLFYHVFNGIRHIVWDAGVGLEIEQANKSGRIVLVATVVASVLFWICIA